MLDPKTLAVLDMQQGFDSRQLAEQSHKPRLDTSELETQRYRAMRMVNLIELSVGEAVKHSEISLRTARWKSAPSAKSIRRCRKIDQRSPPVLVTTAVPCRRN